MKLLHGVRLAAQFLVTFIQYVGRHFEAFLVLTRRYFFTVLAVSLSCAKLVHLFSHRHSLLPVKFLIWGTTFFFQDVIVILLVRLLTQNYRWKWAQILSTVLAICTGYVESIVWVKPLLISILQITHFRHGLGEHLLLSGDRRGNPLEKGS